MMAYTRINWDETKLITSARLNTMDVGIKDAHDHMENTSNPHNVTASQVEALPLTGGTITGNTFLKNGSNSLTTGVKRDISGVEYGTYLAVSPSGDAYFGQMKNGSGINFLTIKENGKALLGSDEILVGGSFLRGMGSGAPTSGKGIEVKDSLIMSYDRDLASYLPMELRGSDLRFFNNKIYHAGNITSGTAAPNGGENGDIYIQYS